MISSGGMTNRLDRLEKVALIERRPDPNDRRGKLIALAAAGRRVIDETITRHVANEEKVLPVLSTAEQEKLDALLRKLIAGCSAGSIEQRRQRRASRGHSNQRQAVLTRIARSRGRTQRPKSSVKTCG
jgi:hypothetical protein